MKPIVLAMIICDHYYRDTHTGKSILTGTFSSINCVEFPTKHGNCAVYIALSDVATNGTAQLTFRKVDNGDQNDSQQNNNIGFEMKLPPWDVRCPEDRRTVVEIGGNINGLPLPGEGDYEFIICWNGSEISSRRLKVNKIELKNQPDQLPDPDLD